MIDDPAAILRRTLEQLIAKWRVEAEHGQKYRLGDAQWSAALSARVYAACADELTAAVVLQLHAFQPSDSDDAICRVCGGWPNDLDHQPLDAALASLPVAPREEELERLRRENARLVSEWSVMARACGNYRDFGMALTPEAQERRQLIADGEYQCAARAIVERDELLAQLAASRDTPPPDRLDIQKVNLQSVANRLNTLLERSTINGPADSLRDTARVLSQLIGALRFAPPPDRREASNASDLLVWLNDEQRKASRWMRRETGVFCFTLTGPELMRIRYVLEAAAPRPSPEPEKEK